MGLGRGLGVRGLRSPSAGSRSGNSEASRGDMRRFIQSPRGDAVGGTETGRTQAQSSATGLKTTCNLARKSGA